MKSAKLRLIAEKPGAEPRPPAPPQVFPRVISVPAGAPWDQARAAGLEARLGAPLPLSEVTWRLKRLESWRPGAPGRYAAFYVRASEVRQGFVAQATVEGRPLTVSFQSRAEQTVKAKKALLLLVGVGVTVATLGLSVAAALAVKARSTEQLEAAERQAQIRVRAAADLEQLKRQARALDAGHLRDRDIAGFLRDLTWASAAKAPDARIDALHWDHGYMAVEVRGETPPFQRLDRPVLKAEKPVRPGVRLWGVAPVEEGRP